MRIRRLTARNYGQFDSVSLEFGPGCTVIYGPNEAGKSTLLHGLGDLLWGINPRRHPYAFAAPVRRMLLSAVLESEMGTYEVLRRSGKLTDSQGEEINPFWSGEGTLSRAAWNNGFGMDLDGLQEGGREVIAGGGDLADLIFLAETGAQINAAREQLQQQMDGLYKEHRGAKKVQIRVQLGQAVDIREEIEAKLVDAPDVEVAREAVEKVEARLARLRAEIAEWQERHGRAEELLRCLPTAVKLRETQLALDELQEGFDGLSRDDCGAVAEALEVVRQQRAASRQKSADKATAQRDLDLLDTDPQLVAHEQAVAELQRSVEKARSAKANSDNPASLEAAENAVRTVLQSLGVAQTEDVAAEVERLTLSQEDRTQLDALAERAGEERLRAGRTATDLRERIDDLESLSGGSDGADSGGELREAREDRDRAWDEIKAPWLSGELPDPAERQAAAATLDRRIAAADAMSETLADQLIEAAHHRGQESEIRKQVERLHRDADAAEAAHRQALADWTDFASGCGLTPGLAPENWKIRARNLDDLAARWEDYGKELRRLEQDRSTFAVFADAVDGLRSLIDSPPVDPFECAGRLSSAVADAKSAAAQQSVLRKQIRELEKAIDDADQEVGSAKALLDQLTGGREPEPLLERSQEIHTRENQLRSLEKILGGQKRDTSATRELLAELESATTAELQSSRDSAGAQVADLQQDLDGANQEYARAREELRRLEGGESIADLRRAQLSLGERIRSLADEFRLLSIQMHLLERLRENLAASERSPVLDRAGVHLSRLTGGRYTGLRKNTDDGEQSLSIVRVDADGPSAEEEVDLQSLSEGTADQLFLALRLAGIEMRQSDRHHKGRVTLPVVLDDILMAFDDERSLAALEVLAELGAQFQILLLTHHHHVVDLARGLEGVDIEEIA